MVVKEDKELCVLDVSTEEDDSILISSGNIRIVVKHNDIGVSVDIYNTESGDEELVQSCQEYFDA